MEPYFSQYYGNPSSIYQLGNQSLRAIRNAREQVAKLIGAENREIVFTSCGTESNNFAIRNVLKLNPAKRKIVTSTVEHSSVRNVMQALGVEGIQIVSVGVNRRGEINMTEFENSLTSDIALVSLMWANNETGVIFPIERIAQLVKSKGILFHVDAVQAAGKIKIDLSEVPIDFLSLSAHKFYGPKGIGILFVRDGIQLPPLIFGGHQERDRRAGTENVPAIVGMGKAAELVQSDFKRKREKIAQLRDRIEKVLLSKIPGSFINGDSSERVCNTINLTIPGVSAETLIPRLDEAGICVSSGSACLTGALEPSVVLQAMGLSEDLARSSIRFSLGYDTTDEEIDFAIECVPQVVAQIRQIRQEKVARHA